MLLYLMFVVQVVVATSTSTMLPPKLYWVPNNAGLFSHFLQLKIMYYKSLEFRRKLVVVPTKSPHYGNRTIDMCSVFLFSKDAIICEPLPSSVSCFRDYPSLVAGNRSSFDICYDGTITFGTPARGRRFVLQAVDLPFLLELNPKHLLLASQFKVALRQTTDAYGQSFSYTVVHWRRGDQLQGRCSRHVDASVNCADAAALVRKVKENTEDTVIYVATNEPQDSSEMAYLRKKGFLTYSDIAHNITAFRGADVFEVLSVEVSLMLGADTFLAWGISEINDVVEHERMLAGRSHCIAQEKPREESQQNWCTLHKKYS